jgi:hypothetical protein
MVFSFSRDAKKLKAPPGLALDRRAVLRHDGEKLWFRVAQSPSANAAQPGSGIHMCIRIRE